MANATPSHVRGADAEWDALVAELNEPGRFNNATIVQHHRPLIEAALSVPAPTLPALDVDAIAKRIVADIEEAERDLDRQADFEAIENIVHENLREALRDAA